MALHKYDVVALKEDVQAIHKELINLSCSDRGKLALFEKFMQLNS
jgi:hypothetical protein